MVAVKGNLEYSINESEKEAYIKNGFDIYKDGKKIADGEHKTVSYTEYKKVKDKLDELEGRALTSSEEVISQISEKNRIIEAKDMELIEKDKIAEKKDKEIAELKAAIATKDEEIKKLKK